MVHTSRKLRGTLSSHRLGLVFLVLRVQLNKAYRALTSGTHKIMGKQIILNQPKCKACHKRRNSVWGENYKVGKMNYFEWRIRKTSLKKRQLNWPPKAATEVACLSHAASPQVEANRCSQCLPVGTKRCLFRAEAGLWGETMVWPWSCLLCTGTTQGGAGHGTEWEKALGQQSLVPSQ